MSSEYSERQNGVKFKVVCLILPPQAAI